MDSRARVEAALALEKADRPPVGLWGHDYLREWSPHLARVTIERQKRFGWDFVKFQPRATCFAEAFGGEYRPSGDATAGPVLVRPRISAAEDFGELLAVSAEASPLGDQVAALAEVAGHLGRSVPVIQTVFSPLTVAVWLAGGDSDLVVRELHERPHLLLRAMNRIADTLIDFARRSIEAGAAGIFFAVSGYASTDVLPAEEYEDKVLPYDRKVLEGLPSTAWFNVLHLCGPRLHFELATSLPCHAVSWSIHEAGNPSLSQGVTRSGRAAMGGLEQRGVLVDGPTEVIAGQVRSAGSENGGRGVLIAPGCSVPPSAPEEHLALVAEVASSP